MADYRSVRRLRSLLTPLLDPRDELLVRWRLLGVLFVVAGALGAVSAVLHPSALGPWTAALSVAAIASGGVVLKTPPPHADALAGGMALGITLISLGAAADDPTYLLFALLYVWVAVESAVLLTPRRGAMLAAFALVTYAVVLVATRAPLPSAVTAWLSTAGSMVVLGGMTWVLRLRNDRLVAELRAVASCDVLTGVPNRRGYRETADRLIAGGARRGRPVSVVLGSIDRFTALNDAHGHHAGDEVLRCFAEVCGDVARATDWTARVGGDTFVVLLPDTEPQQALLVAERLRRTLADRLALLATPGTGSFGVATSPQHGLSADVLLDAAGRAAAAAKALGRDRTVVWSEQLRDEVQAGGNDREHLQAVLVLAETLDLRDTGTARHSHVVGDLSARTAEQLGFTPERVARVRLGGLLHDIGKLGVPDAILQKPAKLTDDEYAQIQQHSELGARILQGANLGDLSEWVLAHHERPDGRGYPFGRTADEIPLEARILGAADAYEAMTAERVYSPAVSPEDAAAELRRCAGSQFDPAVVDALLAALGSGDERGALLVDPA